MAVSAIRPQGAKATYESGLLNPVVRMFIAARMHAAIALRVAEQRYGQGVDDFIDVTVSRAELLRAEHAVVQADPAGPRPCSPNR